MTQKTKFIVAENEAHAWQLFAMIYSPAMFESFEDAKQNADRLTNECDDKQYNVYLIKAQILNIHVGAFTPKPRERGPNIVTMVDPPSGWQYGFPAPLQEDYKQQLIDAGYPEKDLDLALQRSRYWETDIDG